MATRFSILKNHWEKNSVLNEQGKIGTNASLGKDVGGLFLLLDWETKKILKTIDLKNPMGVGFDGKFFYVACLVEDNLSVINKDLEEVRRIKNSFFNVPHSVEIDDDKILIANTGLDEAVIIDKMGDQIAYWSAIENGYDTDQFGKQRTIDRRKLQNDITYPTLTQTTHLNYFNKINEYYYITLFHQGVILRSLDNTKYEVVFSGLNHPHAIRKSSNGFIVSDTKNNRILLLDESVKLIETIDLQLSWVQDVFETKHRTYLITDSNNSRVVEISRSKEILSEWFVPPEWRLFQAIELPPDFNSHESKATN